MRHVPTGWWYEATRDLIDRAMPSKSSSATEGPGDSSSPTMNSASGARRLIRRATRVASTIRAMSSASRRCATSMRGGSSGSADRSRSQPRERGSTSPATSPKTRPVGLNSMGTSNGPAAKTWRSGAPPGGADWERNVAIAWNRAPVAPSFVGKSTAQSGWSTRFAPTPGKSTVTLMPSPASRAAGPIPDRWRIAGLA